MLRFLGLFSEVKEDTLSQALSDSTEYAAFDIVSEHTISRYAEPLAQQARLDLGQQTEEYEAVLGPDRLKELSADFDATPVEEQPFYALQIAHLVAATSAKRMVAAEAVAHEAQQVARMTTAERSEFERLKAEEHLRKAKGKAQARKAQSQPGRKAKRRKRKH